MLRILIIPGDIGSEIDRIERVLSTLHPYYDLISYIPGNHEAWLRGEKYKQLHEDGETWDSIKKLKEIYESLTKYENIKFGPIKVTYPAHPGVMRYLVIQPLHAWYHKSWDTEPEITHELYLKAEAKMSFTKKWIDYSQCRWPIHHTLGEDSKECSTALPEAFALFNEHHLFSLPEVFENVSIEQCIGSKYLSEKGKILLISFF